VRLEYSNFNNFAKFGAWQKMYIKHLMTGHAPNKNILNRTDTLFYFSAESQLRPQYFIPAKHLLNLDLFVFFSVSHDFQDDRRRVKMTLVMRFVFLRLMSNKTFALINFIYGDIFAGYFPNGLQHAPRAINPFSRLHPIVSLFSRQSYRPSLLFFLSL